MDMDSGVGVDCGSRGELDWADEGKREKTGTPVIEEK